MRKQRSIWPALALLAAAASTVMACGSDDDDTGSSSAAVAGCRTLCDKQQAGGCQFFDSVEDCRTFCGLLSSSSADCQTKAQASYDCQNAQPDVCDDAAVNSACSEQIQAEFDCQE